MTQKGRVPTRTAVALVGSVVLLLAAPFAYLAWAFGGLSELVAFVVPLAVLVGLLGATALLARRPHKK